MNRVTELIILVFLVMSARVWADENVQIVRLPDAGRERLILAYHGKIYSYPDRDGSLSAWVLGFELTRNVRHKNFVEQEFANDRSRQKIDVSSALGTQYCRYLKRQAWFKNLEKSIQTCSISYGDFFDSVEPQLTRTFDRFNNSHLEISRIGSVKATVGTNLSEGDHPIAQLSQSLQFKWIPQQGSRTKMKVFLTNKSDNRSKAIN